MSFTSGAVSCWPDVRLTAAARAASMFGQLLVTTTLALALQNAGAGGLAVSGLLLAGCAPIALLSPLAGRLADRADSRLLLVATGTGQTLACALLAFTSTPALAIALVALLSCGVAVTQPTLAALLPAMVRPADLARAGGLTQTAISLGTLAGPAVAGLLIGWSGTRVPLLVAAAGYSMLVAAGVLVRTRRVGAHPRTGNGVSWRVRDDRLILALIASLAAALGTASAINEIEVFFVRESLHASTTVYGVIAASWAAGALLGSAVFARHGGRWTGLPRLILLMMAGCCGAILASSAATHPLAVVPLWLLGGACNAGVNVFMGVLIAQRVPETARGRAFAAMTSAAQGATMAGYLLAGPLIEVFPARSLVAAAGLSGLVAVALTHFPVRRASGRRRDIADSTPVLAAVGHRAGDSVES